MASEGTSRYFSQESSRILDTLMNSEGTPREGRFFIVSGGPQSGRSTFLRNASKDLRNSGMHVIYRQVNNGSLEQPKKLSVGRDEWAAQAGRVVAAAAQIGGAGPVGDLILLIAELATAAKMTTELQVSAASNDPYVLINQLATAIRRCAQQKPLAIFIDDADKLAAPEVWWDTFFGAVLPRAIAQIPFIFVVSIEKAASRPRSHASDVVDFSLLPDQLAEVIELEALNGSNIKECLRPIDDELIDQLLLVSKGQPAWLDEVWRQWLAEQVVLRHEDCWRLSPDARQKTDSFLTTWIETTLRATLGGGADYQRGLNVLRLASLEGPTFTIEAVAMLLSEDVDSLIDWIDETLTRSPANEHALLDEYGFVRRVPGLDPEELRLYRFRSALIAGALRESTLADADGPTVAGLYAHALRQLYHWSPEASSAWTIARLGAIAGDDNIVETTWRRANRLDNARSAAEVSKLLIDELKRGRNSQGKLALAVERLNQVNRTLLGVWDAEETLTSCIAALRAARTIHQSRIRAASGSTINRDELLINSLKWLGNEMYLTGSANKSIGLLREAAKRSAKLDDNIRTAGLFKMLAFAYSYDGRKGFNRNSDVIKAANVALEYAQRDQDFMSLREQASCRVLLAKAMRSDPTVRSQMLSHLIEAAAIVSTLPLGGSELSEHVRELINAAVMLASDEGDAAVLEYFQLAELECTSSTAMRIYQLLTLAATRQFRGEASNSILPSCQALRLSQEFSPEHEAAILQQLAMGAIILENPYARSFAVLASRRSTQLATGQPDVDLTPIVSTVDERAQHDIEQHYRKDRGAALLFEAFNIDAAQLDRANERLGQASDIQQRQYLVAVSDFYSRLQ